MSVIPRLYGDRPQRHQRHLRQRLAYNGPYVNIDIASIDLIANVDKHANLLTKPSLTWAPKPTLPSII